MQVNAHASFPYAATVRKPALQATQLSRETNFLRIYSTPEDDL